MYVSSFTGVFNSPNEASTVGMFPARASPGISALAVRLSIKKFPFVRSRRRSIVFPLNDPPFCIGTANAGEIAPRLTPYGAQS